MGFLAGVTSALLTSTRQVGVLVGVDWPYMHPFGSGFEDGVEYVDPSVEVRRVYLTRENDFSGFSSPTLAFLATNELVSDGVDVVFGAAGESYWGVMESAWSSSQPCCVDTMYGPAWVASANPNRKVWTVAVDYDWHVRIAAESFLGERQAHIATSIVKRLEVGVEETIKEFFATGEVQTFTLGIANGGVDYVTTGGFIDEHILRLEEAKRALVEGEIILTDEQPEDVIFAAELLQR
jgi:basic membrane protein A